MCEQSLARLQEFAAAAVSHYTREQYDRTRGELPSYDVGSPDTGERSKRLNGQQSAAVQRASQTNIDRINHLDVEERNTLFRQAAEQSTFGRNHTAELRRLLQEHGDRFDDMLKTAWHLHYKSQSVSLAKNNI